MRRLVLMTMLLVLVASASVFADQRDGDIYWGRDERSGDYWGITYTRDLDETEGSMETWFRIWHGSGTKYYNRHLQGAYTDPGQSVDTYFGSRLGVNYSPYTAQFHGESYILGLRIANYELGNVTFDGTYVLGAHDNSIFNQLKGLDVLARDVVLGAQGSFGELNLRGALLRHERNDEFYWNYSFLVENSEVYPGITLNGVYAFYQQDAGKDDDWLYQITADWKVNPEVLEVRAGFRDSEIENVGSNVVRGCVTVSIKSGGNDCNNERNRYINNSGRDAINRIFNRDQAYNIGVTTWFDYSDISNRLDVDFTNTNPNRRGDLDAQLTARLRSDVHEFTIDQSISLLFPDANSVNREYAYEDEGLPRYDYRLAVTSPDYDLPYEITATGLFNYDWDKNYVVDPRAHAVAGVRLERTQDIYVLPNVQIGAILTVDMPGRTTPVVQDPFKYALRASYTAPNRAQFRLEYVSSKDFSMGNTSVHGEPVYKRYDRYRMHGTDNSRERFDGIRFVFALPF